MEGYGKLASLMSRYSDHSIFRGFKYLAVKHLLYSQAELLYLEDELNFVCGLDEADQQRRGANRSWRKLFTESSHPGPHKQREIMQAVQEKLPQYCEPVSVSAAKMIQLANLSRRDA